MAYMTYNWQNFCQFHRLRLPSIALLPSQPALPPSQHHRPPLGPRASTAACRRSRLSRGRSLQQCTCSGATREHRLLAPYPARPTVGAATAGWLLNKHQKCPVTLLEGLQNFHPGPRSCLGQGFPRLPPVVPLTLKRGGPGWAPLCSRPRGEAKLHGTGRLLPGRWVAAPGAWCGTGAARRKASHGKRQGGRAGPASEQKVRRGSRRDGCEGPGRYSAAAEGRASGGQRRVRRQDVSLRSAEELGRLLGFCRGAPPGRSIITQCEGTCSSPLVVAVCPEQAGAGYSLCPSALLPPGCSAVVPAGTQHGPETATSSTEGRYTASVKPCGVRKFGEEKKGKANFSVQDFASAVREVL